MLPYLSTEIPFPPVEQALDDPNGLLAAGADLSSERLMQAYSKGIFPWYSPGEPILWWSPDPRTVFFVDHFKVHKSVLKTLRKQNLRVTLNSGFKQTIKRCSLPRSEENGTWITTEMIEAYCDLHHQGFAHSLEVWQDKELVGGIYGVAVGGVFCGESMFSGISNGSKIALSCLARYLKYQGFKLIDCQIENPHLIRLGASNISRRLYLDMLNAGRQLTYDESVWQPQQLNWQTLLDSKRNDFTNAPVHSKSSITNAEFKQPISKFEPSDCENSVLPNTDQFNSDHPEIEV